MSVHITIVIKHDVSGSAFEELAETLLHGLTTMGIEATYKINTVLPHATNIILGAHMLSAEEIELLPSDTIIYNTEQIFPESPWLNSHLLPLIQKFDTWDYSLRNIEQLTALGITKGIYYIPVGFSSALCRIPKAAEQDIDVFFYGSVNERRQRLLEELAARKLKVMLGTASYGKSRDEIISRSKVILNFHFYEAKVFEIVRVSYLLTNRKAVVAEVDEQTDIDPAFIPAVAGVPYHQLVETCVELVNNERKRIALEERGFQIMSSTPEEVYLNRYFQNKIV